MNIEKNICSGSNKLDISPHTSKDQSSTLTLDLSRKLSKMSYGSTEINSMSSLQLMPSILNLNQCS